MKFNALLSSVLCVAASQLVAADIDTTSTSTVTNYITRTLVHVDEVKPTTSSVVSSSSTSSVPVIPTHAIPSIRVQASSAAVSSSAPASSSFASVTVTASASGSPSGSPSGSAAASASHSASLDSGAGSIDARMPVALVAGSIALLLGAL
ncbi:hypothetical protein BO70DRAFT_83360 [Aspergillus heteromorphus CBS 117.55]|uniref:GPI anchored protein n=1 Tax=Aspergillus heteromorphus CBS 117.55 TaxID=1448321 RepID=A0A317WXF6_9EURO|nr:uncharacterized protein BO70DRAFT_83360 [Aspergillus heteromorphus CBS 117.55]PWY91033.1 hypothetical protein BO70DRAFT_83360 [Aspergillus heteromorphus CBS 117.55]